MTAAPAIGAHRLLGDGSTTALLTPLGEIDWWCAPTFDAEPLLWSLLDPHGSRSRWRETRVVASGEAPAGPALRTVVAVRGRRIECCDALLSRPGLGSALARMVRLEPDVPGARPDPVVVEHELGLGGFVASRARWRGGASSVDGASWFLRLGTGVSRVTSCSDVSVTLAVTVTSAWTGLLLTPDADDVFDADAVLELVERSEARLRRDAHHLLLPRTHGERSRHAVAVLRACTDASTGAVVASPTTSLPEALDGDRQFDYRYTWLRDSSLAAAVAAQLGFDRLGADHVDFLRSQGAAQLLSSPLSTTRGGEVPDEREIAGVTGWHGVRPIRIGNDAKGQLQYDAIGTVLESLWVHVRTGGALDAAIWQVVERLAERSVDPPDEPSSGVWELREPRWLVSADVGRWVALDRAVRIARRRRPIRSVCQRARWRAGRDQAQVAVLDAIRDDGSLPMSHRGAGHDELDSSALLVVVLGLLRRNDLRAARLVDATIAGLTAGPHLYRYEPSCDDGFAGTEGTFVPASWWAVAALAVVGRVDDAERRANELCAALPALLPEEIDPVSDESRGNVPLVWSHMEAARALAVLEEAQLRGRLGPPGLWAWRQLRSVRLRVRRRRSGGGGRI
jgi:Glycosyl hydrolases family 15